MITATRPVMVLSRPMTLIEAANYLDVDPATLRQQALKGVLRARKISPNLWVVSPFEVERYQREHLRKGG